MRKLLYFKHWQLFLLIFICGAWTSPSPLKEIINSVAVITGLLWIYAIGTYGQERIIQLGLEPMNLKLFKTNIIIVSLFYVLGLLFSATKEDVIQQASEGFSLVDLISIVCSLYFVFAIFQTTFFAAKTITKIQYNREITFSDCLPNFLCIIRYMDAATENQSTCCTE